MKRSRTSKHDPWISPVVLKLNQKHQSFWKNVSIDILNGNRLAAFTELDRQYRELANTGKESMDEREGIYSWLHEDTRSATMMTSVNIQKNLSPYKPDILILRQHPGKIALSNNENAFAVVEDKKGAPLPADHVGWIDQFRKFGLSMEDSFCISCYMCPYYMADAKYNRDGGTKNMRQILGWRFRMLLWLLEPRFVLASNLLFAKLVESGFDFNSYEDKRGITTYYAKWKELPPPPFFAKKASNVYMTCIRIPHPYLLTGKKIKKVIQDENRKVFSDSVRMLSAMITGDTSDIKEGTISIENLEIPKLQVLAPLKGRVVQPLEVKEEIDDIPKIFTLDHLNTFRQLPSGPCECYACGGCGAYQQSVLNADPDSYKLLYPTSNSYTVTFIEHPSFECSICQCKHGHRSVEYNECPQGCPEGGFKERHKKLLRIDECYTNEEFIQELLERPERFGNEKLLEILERKPLE